MTNHNKRLRGGGGPSLFTFFGGSIVLMFGAVFGVLLINAALFAGAVWFVLEMLQAYGVI
jgi:hypothetical protein